MNKNARARPPLGQSNRSGLSYRNDVFPFVMLINMSLKPTVLITTDFLGLPKEPYWQNFSKALSFVGRPILNSFLMRRVARFHSAARFSERLCLCAASVQG